MTKAVYRRNNLFGLTVSKGESMTLMAENGCKQATMVLRELRAYTLIQHKELTGNSEGL